MRKLLSGVLLILFISLFTSTDIYGQKVCIHDLGKLYVAYQDNGDNTLENYGGMARFIYPNNWYRRNQVQLWYNIFVAKQWKNKAGGTYDMQIWTPEKNHPGTAIAYSMITKKRFKSPTAIVNGLDVSVPFVGTVDATIKSDSYIEWVYKVKDVIGMKSRQQSWAYVNQNFDDFHGHFSSAERTMTASRSVMALPAGPEYSVERIE